MPSGSKPLTGSSRIRLGVAEQGSGDSEPLVHAKREGARERQGPRIMRIVVDLPAPSGPTKAGHPAGLHVEGDSVDGNRGAVGLGEMLRLDHLLFLSRCA